MNHRQTPNDKAALPPDPPPSSDPEPTPHFPKPRKGKHDARPETLADNVKVTPLDEEKHIEQGIEVDEK